MKTLFSSALAHLFTLALLFSCAEPMEQSLTNKKEALLAQRELQTKAINDQLSRGIGETEVKNYLSCWLNISEQEIKDITRYDISEDVYIFIVNLINGKWFLISGDYSSSPILAGGESGGFYIDEGVTYDIRSWLESIKQCILINRDSNTEEAKSHQKEWIRAQKIASWKSGKSNMTLRDGEIDTSDTEVELILIIDTLVLEDYPALTVTNWNQDDPWNFAIPKFSSNYNCLAGCAVIAIAQLLYYTHYAFGVPNDIYANATCNDYYSDYPYTWTFSNPTTTSWDLMSIESYNSSTYFDPYMPALCALIAYRSKTRYGYAPHQCYDYTETYGDTKVDSIPGVLNSFLLSGAYKTGYVLNIPSIRNEIANQRPVLCAGLINQYDTIGHAFLIDGYYHFRRKITDIIQDMDGNILFHDEFYDDIAFWRINTGDPTSRINDYINASTYYPYGRVIFLGWGNNLAN